MKEKYVALKKLYKAELAKFWGVEIIYVVERSYSTSKALANQPHYHWSFNIKC